MQAPYLYVAFACNSIPEDGKMPVEKLGAMVTIQGNQKKCPQQS